MWLRPLEALGADGDPAGEIRAYIDRKLEMSRDNPAASRLFAIEIMQGAPVLNLSFNISDVQSRRPFGLFILQYFGYLPLLINLLNNCQFNLNIRIILLNLIIVNLPSRYFKVLSSIYNLMQSSLEIHPLHLSFSIHPLIPLI